MLKETLLHILFIGAVVFAASFLKKDNIGTTKSPDTIAQTEAIAMDDEHYPYTSSVLPLTDTLKRK